MKKPSSVPADLFKRAALIKDGRDDWHKSKSNGRVIPCEDRRRSRQLACADRWALLQIIEGLEDIIADLRGEVHDTATRYESGYEQALQDLMDDGYRPPHPG